MGMSGMPSLADSVSPEPSGLTAGPAIGFASGSSAASSPGEAAEEVLSSSKFLAGYAYKWDAICQHSKRTPFPTWLGASCPVYLGFSEAEDGAGVSNRPPLGKMDPRNALHCFAMQAGKLYLHHRGVLMSCIGSCMVRDKGTQRQNICVAQRAYLEEFEHFQTAALAGAVVDGRES